MSFNEEMDKIVLDKLGGYSEEPSPDVFQAILEEREQSARKKALNKILLIVAGIAALALLMYLLLRNDKSEGQGSVLYPADEKTASSAGHSSSSLNNPGHSYSQQADIYNNTSGDNYFGLGSTLHSNTAHASGKQNTSDKKGAITSKAKTYTTAKGLQSQIARNTGNDVLEDVTAIKFELQAAYSYLDDSNGVIRFFNQSIHTEDAEYEWYFGDGTSSKDKDAVHKYTRNGIYHTCLSVTTANGHYDSYCQEVTVDNLPRFKNLIGKVNAGNSIPDKGWVYLIKYDSTMGVPYLIDSNKLDAMGYFSFPEQPMGYYIVRAIIEPRSIHYKEYLPTYFGQTLVWNLAKRYNLDGTNRPSSELLVINLLSLSEVSKGNLKLEGKTETAGGELDENLLVLYDENGKPIGFTKTDGNGNFSFNNLPPGSYKIFNPKTGTYTTYSTPPVVTAGSTVKSEPPPGETGGSKPDNTPPSSEITVWPVPCIDGTLNIKFNNPEKLSWVIKIRDYYQKEKFTQSSSPYLNTVEEVQLNIDMLPPGMYIVEVKKSNGLSKTVSFSK